MKNDLQILEFEKPLVELERMLAHLHAHNNDHDLKAEQEIKKIEGKITQLRHDIYDNLTPWQRIQIARHPKRPYTFDYLNLCFEEFVELHGDRQYSDDQALIGGLAKLDSHRVMVIGHQKGRDTRERARRNFGMANPEGYRKALRLMQLADKFHLPVISFIDTPGAFPGVEAEERHIAEAIAINLREMFSLNVPIIAIIIGEGGSGGALGIAVANRVLILENAYYSVISPEGCAAILWKDRAKAPQAAEALKISAKELEEFGLVDEIIPEPLGGAHYQPDVCAKNLKAALLKHLTALQKLKPETLIKNRQTKFRNFGQFFEPKSS
ncbi:MAG: acetyl-CoA carboxylase carboxyltransferase subunit alpha [Verrucomicrobiia bacterium]